MEEHQKIAILLAEYNTLRAEVLAARSYVAQAVSITAAVVMGVIGFSFSTSFKVPTWVPWCVTGVAIAYLGITFGWNEASTRRFTKRLRALEADVNARAGERLLIWESDFGWGSMAVRRTTDGKPGVPADGPRPPGSARG